VFRGKIETMTTGVLFANRFNLGFKTLDTVNVIYVLAFQAFDQLRHTV